MKSQNPLLCEQGNAADANMFQSSHFGHLCINPSTRKDLLAFLTFCYRPVGYLSMARPDGCLFYCIRVLGWEIPQGKHPSISQVICETNTFTQVIGRL